MNRPHRVPPHVRRAAPAVALVAAAALLAWAASPAGDAFAPLARREAPARALASPKLRRALLRKGRLGLRPPSRPAAGDRCAEVEITAGPAAGADLPSTVLAAPWRERLPGATLFSLHLDPCHRRRLEANRLARGRQFEETGWLSVFSGGELRSAGAVGVRVHGGDSRKRNPLSLRLYFDDDHGARGLPAELLAPELDGTLRRAVLLRDEARDREGKRWYFLEAINYDVARRLGARAPWAQPVGVTVDGEPPRVMLLAEHPGRDALRRRLGHGDFEWLRMKEEPGSAHSSGRDRLTALVRDAPAPLTAAWAADRFDLDLLLAWTVTALVCGTGEPFQAVAFRDRTGAVAGGRWSWLLWDLDQSFFDTPNFHRFGVGNDALGYLFTGRNSGMPAGLLVQRLLREDPAFRRALAGRIGTALRDELTPPYFADLVARYRLVARRLGVEDLRFLDDLDEFFARRRLDLPREVERHLG